MLPRIEWPALVTIASELGFTTLPSTKPEGAGLDEKTKKDLHTLLLETQVTEGKLCCANCGHEYKIHQGIANFLLPSHLGEFLGRSFFLMVDRCFEKSTNPFVVV